MFGRIHQGSQPIGFFFVEMLLIADSIYLFSMGFIRFSIFQSVFIICVFPGIYPFNLNYLFGLESVVHSNLLSSFLFLWHRQNCLHVHFLFFCFSDQIELIKTFVFTQYLLIITQPMFISDFIYFHLFSPLVSLAKDLSVC